MNLLKVSVERGLNLKLLFIIESSYLFSMWMLYIIYKNATNTEKKKKYAVF